MNDINLANPAWAHAIWLALGFVAVLMMCERRGTALLERLVAPLMQLRLVSRPSQTRRLMRCGLLGLTAVLLIVALMRPQWGLYYEEAPRAGTELMVCLDVSKSMLAEDVSPSRLERAKAEVADLLTYLEGDQVGLIAFAGRATVLCPLTPDFSFLRMVLDAAGPHTVARGGTDLAAPVLQAVAGFGGAGDVSRAILLITDGEDLGSFPVEAAKKAAERGIKIFTIGLGSEEGSQIMFTDRRSGARTLLTDADGQPVVSRLSGDTLREMALATQGAYVPAGTGVLDLDSIYRDLLAPLTRGQLDGRGRPMRKEGFQWAVMLALITLLGAVGITAGQASASRPPGAGLAAAILLVLLVTPQKLSAQPSASPAAQPPGAAEKSAAPADDAAAPRAAADSAAADAAADGAADEAADAASGDPRLDYNHGIELLASGDFDEAEKQFLAVRQEAGPDGPARYRATYNLGWVYVKRHDSVLESDGAEGLRHLQTAASWFREAVRLRPEETDARHNLEVVMRKALALADALRQDQDDDVTKRLDQLIETQRGFLGQARSLTTQAALKQESAALDAFRTDFRALATEQRQIVSDAGRLADDAAQQRDAIEAKAEDQRSPEEKVRAAQLSAALHYLHEASERLGQARRQLKQQSGERGCRRAAAGLSKLRRARDQLRDPVAVLGAIIEDTGQLVEQTMTHAAASGLGEIKLPEDEPAGPGKPAAPPWLTIEYLQEEQHELAQRGQELHLHLDAGLAGLDAKGAPPQDAASPENAASPESQRFITQLRAALPLINTGQEALGLAAAHLDTQAVQEAIAEQRRAIQDLLEAREQFLDHRGLIELLYSSQRQLQALLKSDGGALQEALAELTPALMALEQKDMHRAGRLRAMLDEQLQQIPPESAEPAAAASSPNTQQPPGAAPEPTPEQNKAQRQRLELALQLLNAATYEMKSASDAFQAGSPGEPTPAGEQPESLQTTAPTPAALPTSAVAAEPTPPAADGTQPAASAAPASAPAVSAAETVQRAAVAVDRTVTFMADLRRLFLSIIEHLQETAQRQQELLADTAEVGAETDHGARATALGPLAPRQKQLAAVSGEIAGALAEQSKEAPEVPAGQQPDKAQEEQIRQTQDRLARAAELVQAARGEMDQASGSLQAAPPELENTQQHQHTAWEQLVAALHLLQPPQEQQQQPDQDQQQQQQQQQQAEEDQKQEQQQGSQADLARLLQGVRDREAQRRAERDKSAVQRYEPVEKDW